MLCLAIGASGFAAMILYDLAQLRGKRVVATLLSSIGYLCIVASMVFLFLTDKPPRGPVDALVPKLLVALLSLVLLVYSVFIEIPIASRHRPASSKRVVVSAGFYGIVRHPAFLWFVLLWISIILIYHDSFVADFGLCLIILDLVLIVLEDAFFFPRIFAGYDAYKRRVPFLIPRLRRNGNNVHL